MSELLIRSKKNILKKPFDYFNQKQVWSNFFSQDTFFRQKTRIMLAMIPESVQSVLDVGCGNGELTRFLAQKYYTVGVDLNRTPLQTGSFLKIQADSAFLSFQNHSFDLIFSSELLEHLPSSTFKQTIKEFQRITRDYILISVPYRENLNLRILKCPVCRLKFHVWGHRQRFHFKKISTLFPHFKLISWTFCGNHAFDYHPILLFIRQRILNQWYDASGTAPLCPGCGNQKFEHHSTRLTDWLNRLNQYFKHHISRDPYWIVALFKRRSS